jgi:hypothetical protein
MLNVASGRPLDKITSLRTRHIEHLTGGDFLMTERDMESFATMIKAVDAAPRAPIGDTGGEHPCI